MPKSSAGILLYRLMGGSLEVLLVHPGGPFWAKKDTGAWSIPKGELWAGEDALAAAKREFEEETGSSPEGTMLPLGTVTQKSGKVVSAWALQGDCDPKSIKSNSFEIEWPPRSGKKQEFPEIDRAGFFEIEDAKRRINPAQTEFLTRLQRLLSTPASN
ncbi:MAG: NUDIX domain-containing protein [Terriglobia bacterium]